MPLRKTVLEAGAPCIPAVIAPAQSGPITSIHAVQVTGPVPTLLIPLISKMVKNRSLKSILNEYLPRTQIRKIMRTLIAR